MNMRALAISAVVAGAVMAVLSAIPIISLVNCLLCGWIWGGGIAAVWLYRRINNGQAATMGNAIVTGLLAGVVAAVVGSLLQAITGAGSAAVANALRSTQGADLPTGLIETFASPLFTFAILLIIYPIFGLIGGAIGGAIWKPAQQPGQPPYYGQGQ